MSTPGEMRPAPNLPDAPGPAPQQSELPSRPCVGSTAALMHEPRSRKEDLVHHAIMKPGLYTSKR